MNPSDPKSFFSLEEFEHKELFHSIDHVWEALKNLPSYLKSQSLGKIESNIPEGVILQEAHLISIGKGCIVEPGAFIQGPCIIGEGSIIRHGAYIRGNVLMGKKCVVGHASEIKNSILLNHAAAAHFNYVGDSILGNNTNLGAGVVCANLRLDKKQISLIIAGKAFHTEMQKLGVILGDGSQIGCNSVANPGTLIGKDSFCFPCLNFGGWIPSGSMVKGQHFTVEAK